MKPVPAYRQPCFLPTPPTPDGSIDLAAPEPATAASTPPIYCVGPVPPRLSTPLSHTVLLAGQPLDQPCPTKIKIVFLRKVRNGDRGMESSGLDDPCMNHVSLMAFKLISKLRHYISGRPRSSLNILVSSSLNSCTSQLTSSPDAFKGKKVGAGLEGPLLYRTGIGVEKLLGNDCLPTPRALCSLLTLFTTKLHELVASLFSLPAASFAFRRVVLFHTLRCGAEYGTQLVRSVETRSLNPSAVSFAAKLHTGRRENTGQERKTKVVAVLPLENPQPRVVSQKSPTQFSRDTWFASFNLSIPSPPLALGSHLSLKVISYFQGGRQAAHSDIEGRSNFLILYEIICHSYYLMILLGLRFFHLLYGFIAQFSLYQPLTISYRQVGMTALSAYATKAASQAALTANYARLGGRASLFVSVGALVASIQGREIEIVTNLVGGNEGIPGIGKKLHSGRVLG
ncbi:hypothetical protein M9H77_23569 [Catharanthus roseus]|uniref:Uncharacterized protein n=1 Tax=Catharanthus roseus TaxID=4058 RepID=A0ACC0AXR5_CATRO|nr:hypothetical protein M9H77_23569 [Catharanthus roseus]